MRSTSSTNNLAGKVPFKSHSFTQKSRIRFSHQGKMSNSLQSNELLLLKNCQLWEALENL